LPAAVVLAAMILAVLALDVAGQPQNDAELPSNPLRGRRLFESKGCTGCHGIAGISSGSGPSLGEGSFGGTFLELGAALWNHAPDMSVTMEVTGFDWPQLSEADASEILAFLYFIDYLGRPGVADEGRRVFEDGGCAACHVIGGGAVSMGSDLAELGRFASPLYVAQEIWNHGPSMLEGMREMDIEPPRFEESDLADLSAFIRQEATPGLREPLLSAPGDPNTGRALFATKGCASCHGRAAGGGSGGPDLSEFDLHRSAEAIAGIMWNHSLAMSDAMRQRGIGWPEFEDSELADLVAFLYFLSFVDPPGDGDRGAEVFADQRCAECHAGARSSDPTVLEGPLLVRSGAVTTEAALVAAMWNHAPIMKRAILRQGRRWPELSGRDLRDLFQYLQR
jgi:mono/diheme cytochrome c family protein